MATLFLLLIVSGTCQELVAQPAEKPDIVTIIQVLAGSKSEQRIALRKLRNNWNMSFMTPLVELLRLNTDADTQVAIVKLLEGKTGKRFGADYQKWHEWIWLQKLNSVEHYAEFKAWLYGNIDPRFKGYFSSGYAAEIRLDEILWGGVNQDGIPPLRQPKMISATEATYLEDDHVVFAIEVNGDYRAFPKRILGWHEMVVDTVGGVDLVGVYCTLCGAMIIYETLLDGTHHHLGTSGFLYRSNKLMYDKNTQSLWNSFWGRPVMGPLTGKGISLKRRSVVTTTWGEWKTRHPQTSVLSLETHYNVNYDEGAAYKRYFATDKLMFKVPSLDPRLKNKAEILGIHSSTGQTLESQPLAISAAFLVRNPIYYDQSSGSKIVVLTDKSGANRVFDGGVEFSRWDQQDQLIDKKGTAWVMTESSLKSETGETLLRVPAHRAFWFGWYSAFNNTRLIH